jgi:hypothetical protein
MTNSTQKAMKTACFDMIPSSNPLAAQVARPLKADLDLAERALLPCEGLFHPHPP